MKKTFLVCLLATLITCFASHAHAHAAQVHDFDISYHRYLNTDTVKNRDAKTVEEIIFYWADAFYEATNGECTLGTVRIYQGPTKYISDYKQSDIVWDASGHPMAASGGGMLNSPLKTLGCRITMYDTFKDMGTGKNICNFMNGGKDAAYAGYLLAALTSSYLFDLRGEYAVERGGNSYAALPCESIMKDVSPAAYADNINALNYSTASMYSAKENTEQRAQWGVSGWAYLKKQNLLKNIPSKSKKNTQYLVETEPGKHNKAAIKNLRIVWVYSPVYVMAIDRSGSMHGDRLERAKYAAKDYIQNLKPGVRIGLIDFAGDVMKLSEIKKITAGNAQSQKKELMGIIDSIPIEGNGTSIYDACFGAQVLMAEDKNSIFDGRHIILITDGEDNSSKVSPQELIDSCRKEKIAVNVIGLEEGVNEKTLRSIADSTKGYYIMTANPLDTQEMLYSYMNNAAESQVGTKDTILKPGQSTRLDFLVDDKSEMLRINVIQTSVATPKGLTVSVQHASGKPVGAKFDQNTGKYEVTQKNPSKGLWTANVKNNGKQNTVVRATAYVKCKGNALFMPGIKVVPGEKPGVHYAYACLTGNGIPYTGLSIKATLTRPRGKTEQLEFTDKGIYGDAVANDGIFTAQMKDCTAKGNYMLTVSFANGGSAVSATGRYYLAYPKDLNGIYNINDNAIKLITKMERVATYTFQKAEGNAIVSKAVDWDKLKDKMGMANDAFKRNDYETAISYTKEAERIKKDHGPIYRLRGEIFDAQNYYDASVQEYLLACKFEPGEAINYYKLGQVYVYMRQISKAKEVLATMQSKWPNEKWTNQLEVAIGHVK